MVNERKPLNKITIEEMDRELIARGKYSLDSSLFHFQDREGTPQRYDLMEHTKALYVAAPPPIPNEVLRHIDTWELAQLVLLKSKEINKARGIWNYDNRVDVYEIRKELVKRNADCVAAICLDKDLLAEKNGNSSIRVKNYGVTFNLCSQEPFYHQPIAVGWLCTGFLVKEDVIATAAHCADENNVKDLRIVFGFIMSGPSTPVTQVPNKNIYKGVKIIHRVYNPLGNGSDWALVELDRKVVGKPVVKLFEKAIYRNQPVYIFGHPCGLPLKYSAGARVRGIYEPFFSADLNVYCGSSGSPVFDSNTHEVIGMVVRGDNRDFRWTGKGWLSIIYPNPDIQSREPQCTRVSQFIDIIDKCCE
jgi:hypothetical protein